MAIYIWIVDKNGTITNDTYESQSKFDLMEDLGIYHHLQLLWDNVYNETGKKINDDEDGWYEKLELISFLNLVNEEIEKCKAIKVNDWEFSIHSKAYTFINGLANFNNKNNLSEVEFKTQTYKIVKTKLLEYLDQLRLKIVRAIKFDKRLYLSYA